MPAWRYTLGSWGGEPVQAHASLLLIAGSIALRQPGLMAMLLVFALLIGVVFLHEAAHALTGRWRGYPIQGLSLHAFGGLSSLRDSPSAVLDDVLITLAGPASSLILGAGLVAAAASLPFPAWWMDSMRTAGFTSLYWGAFNLLPGQPMDGGRLLYRALACRRPPLVSALSTIRTSQVILLLIALHGVLALRLTWIALAVYLYGVGLAAASELLRQAHTATDTATVSPPPYARSRPTRVDIKRES